MPLKRIIWIACALILSACGPSDQDKKDSKERADFEAQLATQTKVFSSTESAREATEASIRKHVRYISDSAIQVYEILPEYSHTFPTSTPWMWDCGSGAQLNFGNMPPTGEGDDKVDNNVHIIVAMVPVPKPICDDLAPRVAQLLKDIEAGK